MARVSNKQTKTTQDPNNENVTPQSTESVTEQLMVTHVPDSIDGVLAAFSNYQELYIDRFGSVYTTKPTDSSAAILYKNPHYQSE